MAMGSGKKREALSRRRRSRGGAAAVLFGLIAGACGGSTRQTPSLGSESHFLAQCSGSCAAGLDCIGGICTRPCLTSQDSCSDLASGARCTNQSVEPGQVGVCDLSCESASDCGSLGAGHVCASGFCREAGALAPGDGTPDPGTNPGEPAGVDCESFRDQVPPPDVRQISIVNLGSAPLYLLPVRLECEAPSFVSVKRDGQPVNTQGLSECRDHCQTVLESGGPGPCGIPLCPAPDARRLEPGETLQQAVGVEVVERQLPRACAAGVPAETLSCDALVIPPPGAYTLFVHAVLEIEGCNARQNCLCAVDGTCNTTNPPLEFSLQTSSYYQSQVFNIAAP